MCRGRRSSIRRRRPASSSCCRSPTPATACRRRCWSAPSSPSSRPRSRAAAPASASAPSTASPSSRADTSTIESEVGIGTTVSLYLPRADAGAERRPLRISRSRCRLSENNEVVLVVEDNRRGARAHSAARRGPRLRRARGRERAGRGTRSRKRRARRSRASATSSWPAACRATTWPAGSASTPRTSASC